MAIFNSYFALPEVNLNTSAVGWVQPTYTPGVTTLYLDPQAVHPESLFMGLLKVKCTYCVHRWSMIILETLKGNGELLISQHCKATAHESNLAQSSFSARDIPRSAASVPLFVTSVQGPGNLTAGIRKSSVLLLALWGPNLHSKGDVIIPVSVIWGTHQHISHLQIRCSILDFPLFPAAAQNFHRKALKMPNMPNTLWRGTYGIDIMAGSWPFRVAVQGQKRICQYFWANYYNSLTWIKAIWGWFPLLTMISSELVVSSL